MPLSKQRMLLRIATCAQDWQLLLIWRLVWPQMMMFLCTTVINLTDTWVAGKISSDVQASMGLAFQVQMFLMVFAASLGAGGLASVSQSMGAGNSKRARNFAGLVLSAAFSIALLLTCLLFAWRTPVLRILQTPEMILPLADYILRFMLLGFPFACVMQVGGTLFRAARHVTAPLVVMLAACAINLAGDLLFGLGMGGFPRLGMRGIIWSTLAANILGAAMTVAILKRGGMLPPFLLPPLAWGRKAFSYLLSVSVPALGNGVMWQTGYLVLYGLAASLPDGVAALAGLTAGNRVESMLYMPAAAFMATASILVGNALGHGDKPAAKKAGLVLFVLSGTIIGSAAAVIWPFISDLARIFSHDAAVQWQIRKYLFYNVLAAPLTVSGLVLHGVLNGAGATVYSMLVNIAGIWIVRLPMAWLLSARVFHNAEGLYAAMLLSIAAQTAIIIWIFLRRDWYAFSLKSKYSKRTLPTEKD